MKNNEYDGEFGDLDNSKDKINKITAILSPIKFSPT